jgi:hypothetical protein
MVWVLLGVVTALAILLFGMMPFWVKLVKSPSTGPPPEAFTVTIEGAPGGSVHYREGAHEHRFDWELAAKTPSVCFVYVPTYERWPVEVPWAPERREEILYRVAREVQDQKCRGSRWEVGETMIHFFER